MRDDFHMLNWGACFLPDNGYSQKPGFIIPAFVCGQPVLCFPKWIVKLDADSLNWRQFKIVQNLALMPFWAM